MPKTRRWKLPRPPRGAKTEWTPIVRLGSVVPFGYKQDPEDKDILLPIPEELVLLEKAKDHLKKYPSREVAEWLYKESGRYISHVGLLQRLNIESKRQHALSITEYYARKYKEAKEKSEKIKGKIGANARKEDSTG